MDTPTASQHNIFDSEQTLTNSFMFLLTQTGFEPRVFCISSPTLNQLSHPVTRSAAVIVIRNAAVVTIMHRYRKVVTVAGVIIAFTS